MKKWINVKDKMPIPGKKVIAYYKNELGKDRIIMAEYAPKFTLEADAYVEEDFTEYNDGDDVFYLPEGWYESNEFDEINYYVEGNITHWMPLPTVPGTTWGIVFTRLRRKGWDLAYCAYRADERMKSTYKGI